MKNNYRLIFAILAFTTTASFADSYSKLPDFKNPGDMANYYSQRIEQRERENLEQLHFEQEREQRHRIENELRDQRRQYEIDRIIDGR